MTDAHKIQAAIDATSIKEIGDMLQAERRRVAMMVEWRKTDAEVHAANMAEERARYLRLLEVSEKRVIRINDLKMQLAKYERHDRDPVDAHN